MFTIAIIGGGIIGTAIAYSLIPYDAEVILFDKENDIAMGSTRANSGIVHAGYDPMPGTLMARLNREGNAMMEKRCRDLSVAFERCGSLVLAFSEEEVEILKTLLERGKANGVEDLRILDADELRETEPQASPDAVAALYAPSAGIVNPWMLCIAQAEVFVGNGGKVLTDCEVTAIKKMPDGYTIHTSKGIYEAQLVIAAAGAFSDDVHAMVSKPDFEITPWRGEYYLLDKSEGERAKHTIFQCPSRSGKGVLVSPTIHGNLIVGPSSELIHDPADTSTTQDKLDFIREKASLSVPSIRWSMNVRNFSGVRANSTIDDFIIREVPGSAGLFEAAGIRSPGLASSPAIGEYVVKMILQADFSLPRKTDGYFLKRDKVYFHELNAEERESLIASNPLYGRVICRCEEITEGEIIDALHSPIPPVSLDGIKRRTGAGMGRCQGGFCGPRIVAMLAEMLDQSPLTMIQDRNGSYLFVPKVNEKTEDGAQEREVRI